ncbi:uncharacterized protein LOC129771856 [Toxorhynchites rutilus septentrionalis]|uniref:uncharacterized protein LOC129771856 n=1 Tax=Toxorhynchites rutilus septentrionalis TaxID=329112 RepID=UPI002478CBA2|nr:uncharacterized protein LOC129771856 [Toxorhynchites rutilus septentrionalis]
MENVSGNDGRCCGKCDRPESADNMVCCDECDVWVHFGCAGVGDSIAEPGRVWKCDQCRKDVPTEQSVHLSQGSAALSRRSQRLHLSLQLLEEQREMKKKQAVEEEEYLKKKYDLLIQIEENDNVSTRRSEVSAKSRRERVEGWINKGNTTAEGARSVRTQSNNLASTQLGASGEEANIALETQSVPKSLAPLPQSSSTPKTSAPTLGTASAIVTESPRQTFVTSEIGKSAPVDQMFRDVNTPAIVVKAALPSTATITFSSDQLIQSSRQNISSAQQMKPLQNATVYDESSSRPAPLMSTYYVPTRNICEMTNSNIRSTRDMRNAFSQYNSSTSQSRTFCPNQPPYVQSIANEVRPGWPVHTIQQGPTNSQLAARQVLSRELPIFSGDPEDWPMFYSSFKNTTEVCGYSDAENLARLQRCLRGHALETVKRRLLLPASVPNVMETLHKLYGRPEILINSLLKKLRSVAPPKAESLGTIITYGLAVQNLVDHLIIAGQHAHLWNPMLLQEMVEKLPASIKIQWGWFKQTRENVNLATFNEFMAGLVNLASDLTLNVEYTPNSTKSSKTEKAKQKESLFVHSQESSDVNEKSESIIKVCSYCDSPSHRILDCLDFQKLDIDGRWKAVRLRNLCRTCLIPHRKWPCRSKKECGQDGCRIHHHPLLHSVSKVSSDPVASTSYDRTVYQNHHSNHSFSFFRYVPVTIVGNGKQTDIFAFLDEGSSSTLLEAEVADRLGIKGPMNPLILAWTSKITREEKSSRSISLTISGKGLTKKYAIENVQTVHKMELPKQSMCYEELAEQFPYLRGLPVKSYTNVAPQMIIGLEHVRLLTSLKLREGNSCGPIAVKTRLGWCAFGRQAGAGKMVERVNLHYSISNQRLHNLMKHFFLVEESTVTSKPEAEADKQAIEILNRTVKRKGNYFESGLLWKYENPVFPNSLPLAQKRLASFEKRLTRNPVLRDMVKQQLEQYQQKGYAHKASKGELENTDERRVWYLPLGVVTNPNKPNKIRLVWDAAARVNGVSFNDMLLKGPDLLNSLPVVLTRFRQKTSQ